MIKSRVNTGDSYLWPFKSHNMLISFIKQVTKCKKDSANTVHATLANVVCNSDITASKSMSDHS